MKWVGIFFSQAGFFYSCFKDIQPLLESSARDLLAKAVPFDNDVTTVNEVCRQMYRETSLLPLKLWLCAFEDTFTLDQFVTARGLRSIPLHHKEAIRRVAVGSPGPHRSYEKVLQSLQEVLLIRSGPADSDQSRDSIFSSKYTPVETGYADRHLTTRQMNLKKQSLCNRSVREWKQNTRASSSRRSLP
ncbi:hypothetical protein M3J09_010340 [Ascochyta lentis]